MKKIFSVLLTVVMCVSLVARLNVTAFAASYPSISSSQYIEFTAQQNINVYNDTSCKTRGTSSPSKKYNASVSTGDICYIYKITNSYIQINYPTSSGRRTGYIKRTDLFDKTSPEEYISSAKAKVNVYKTTSGSYIAKGDKVWRVDPKKGYDGYRAVIYEAKSGKRAYKMGYIKLNDLEKIKESSGSSNSATQSKTNDKNETKVVESKQITESTKIKTITVSANSLESWCEQIKRAELSMTALGRPLEDISGNKWHNGYVIIERTVLSTKKVQVKIPSNKQGPLLNDYKLVYVELPYTIKYTLHTHNFENKITEEYFGRFLAGLINQEIVHTQTCECGLSKSVAWQIPDMVVDKVTAGGTYKVTSSIKPVK